MLLGRRKKRIWTGRHRHARSHSMLASLAQSRRPKQSKSPFESTVSAILKPSQQPRGSDQTTDLPNSTFQETFSLLEGSTEPLESTPTFRDSKRDSKKIEGG